MEKVIVEIEIKDGKAVASLDKTAEKVEGIGQAAKKAKTGVKSFGKTIGNLTKSLGIVGLLAGAFQVLQEAFKNNQQVMDVFSTATTALGIVVNDLFTYISDNVTPIVEWFKQLFEDPIGNLEDFGDAIKDNIIERFESWLDTLGLLASAVKKLFSGDVAGAFDDVKEAGKEMVDVVTGVDGSFEKIGETIEKGVDAVVEYTTATVKMASAIVNAEKSLVILENTQTRVREQADRDAEQQRQIRDDVTKSIDDRIEANTKLAKILDDQQKNELAAVDAQIAALSVRLALDKNNQELQNEIFKLNTERSAVEAQQAGFRSEQQTNEKGLIQEKMDLLNELNLIGSDEFQRQVIEAEQLAELQRATIEREITDETEKKRLLELVEQEYQDNINAIEEDAAAKSKATRDKKADDEKKVAKEEFDTKVKFAQLASQGLQAIGDLLNKKGEEDSRKSFERNKAFSLGQSLVNTALAVTAALTAGGNPAKLATGAQFFEAALAATIGGASSLKIANSKYGGGGVTPPIVANPSANIAPPTFNAPTNDNNQLAETFAGALANKPVKAYVVSGDVTTAQQMDRITNDNATL